MPKYLLQASYTVDGLKGLAKDTASARKAAVEKAVTGLGGKLEALYFAFGKDDAILIVDLPDNVSAAAFSLTASATGAVRGRTTPLLTAEEVDKALKKTVTYRAPGQ